ncbi:DUF2993 domain-containing protein [Vulcanococcus limneticus]|uniref:LmeA family phospholipid-binding protein n=1 Tax=Vulcanococcus limneticus TaxID=2170428 RepID=UPI001E5D5B1D|nr:DUF2993 domain-containing protein [Vulcanococcus limneticus]
MADDGNAPDPSTPPDAPTGTTPGSGPLMSLLASGLELWIRQQCEAVESLELQLHGTALQLLRGRLEGVTLLARRVVFNALEIELMELRSEAIQVQVGNLLKGRALQLDHPFLVRGQAAFTGEGLSRSLAAPQWRCLGDQLAEALLGLSPLQDLRIVRDSLVLAAEASVDHQRVELETRPQAVEGELEIQALQSDNRYRLPGDPNIRIEVANLEGGMLQLHGEARVSP